MFFSKEIAWGGYGLIELPPKEDTLLNILGGTLRPPLEDTL
jgi:hypothetical protein